MREVIKKEEVSKLNHYGRIYTVMLIATVLSAIILFMWIGIRAFLPWGLIFAITMYYGFKVEKVKKENDIQTFKEIMAFSEAVPLDEKQKQQEIGKRAYQKVFLVVGSAIIAVAFCFLTGALMHVFLN